MSAWYLFTALGFYPVNPVSGEYVVGRYAFSFRHHGSMCSSRVQSLLRQGLDRPAVVEREIRDHFSWSAVQALCALSERKRPRRGTAHHPTRSNRTGRCLVVPNEGYATGLGEWVDVPAVNRWCPCWNECASTRRFHHVR